MYPLLSSFRSNAVEKLQRKSNSRVYSVEHSAKVSFSWIPQVRHPKLFQQCVKVSLPQHFHFKYAHAHVHAHTPTHTHTHTHTHTSLFVVQFPVTNSFFHSARDLLIIPTHLCMGQSKYDNFIVIVHNGCQNLQEMRHPQSLSHS